MEHTILLNADFTFLSLIDWKKAVKLLVKKKAEVIEVSKRIVTGTGKFPCIVIPKIMRLVKLVKTLYKNKVPYSKKNVMIRDNFTCQYCGNETNLTIDHVIPESRGGPTNFENCVTCCKTCNNIKNNRTPSEANMTLKRKPYQPTTIEFIMLKVKRRNIDKIIDEFFSKLN